ncbi:hypothetical protein ETI10_10520 [Macrococcoides goetzii]|nr:hypothetical protein [Macrococcus goetzii]TDM39869.1 hypothetical protein ETI10_10520 [Macrococcus goetzii]
MIFLELDSWKRLFNVYAYKNWQTSYKDKRYGNVFYTVENGTYLTLDVANEVYVEEFKTAQEMRLFYGEDVHEQLTLF